MKTVLILTYYWPPAGGPGVQRWLKFVKYLEEYGWKAHILTVKDGTYSAFDEELEKEIPAGIRVTKTNSRDPFHIYNFLKGKKSGSVSVALININKRRSPVDRLAMYIRSNWFIPDARKGWIPYAFREVMKIISKQDIDLLITTGPPHSTHLTGLKVKQKTGIKWLADFRDPWTSVFYNDMLPRTARTRRTDKRYEDAVLEHADAVTVVSPGMQKEFIGRNRNTRVVMNGFDIEDMRVAEKERVGEAENGEFSLVYTGNFKPNQHIPVLWDAIRELMDENENFAGDFRLRFVGNVDGSVPDYFKERNMSGNLELIPYVSHTEVTRFMEQATLLLFVVPQSRNNRLIITGKLFEYLASGTPLFAIGPQDGDAASIVSDTGRGEMLAYNDRDAFRQKLMQDYTDWKDHHRNLPKLETGMLEKYSRRSSARLMAEIMKETIL